MLQALAIILIIGIACTVATLIVSFVAIWLSSDDDEKKGYTAAVWIALGFNSATVFFLILAGLVGTAGPQVAEDKIRGLGAEVGVNAAAGKLWLALPWIGVLLMAVVLGYWARRARVLRKLRNEEKEKEKEDEEVELESRSSRRSSRSSRSFHTARRSRSRHSTHRSRHRCRSCRR
jgi:MFS family permease